MFSFKNIGHYVAVAARDIVKFGGAVKKEEGLIEGLTALVYPPAVVIERAAFGALGYAIDAADKLGPVADGQVTLTIQVAADELKDLKALVGFFKSHASASGVLLPPVK